MQPLTYAALDFETANQSRASVCQIGVSIWDNGTHTGTYTTLVTPPPGHDEFNKYAVRVHGITANHVIGAPTWPEALPQLLALIGGRPVFAHNAGVERSVLAQASTAHDLPHPNVDLYCTYTAARRLLPDMPKKRLPDMAARYGIPCNNHHDAGADAFVAGALVPHLMSEAGTGTLDAFLDHIYPGARTRRAS